MVHMLQLPFGDSAVLCRRLPPSFVWLLSLTTGAREWSTHVLLSVLLKVTLNTASNRQISVFITRIMKNAWIHNSHGNRCNLWDCVLTLNTPPAIRRIYVTDSVHRKLSLFPGKRTVPVSWNLVKLQIESKCTLENLSCSTALNLVCCPLCFV